MFGSKRDGSCVIAGGNADIEQSGKIRATILEEAQQELDVLRGFAIAHFQFVLRQSFRVTLDVKLIAADQHELWRRIGEDDGEGLRGAIAEVTKTLDVPGRKSPVERLPQIGLESLRGALMRDIHVGVGLSTHRDPAGEENQGRDKGAN